MRDRLLGFDGRGPARGTNRIELLKALTEDVLTEELWPALAGEFRAELDKTARAARRRPRVNHTTGALSTSNGWTRSDSEVPPAMDVYRKEAFIRGRSIRGYVWPSDSGLGSTDGWAPRRHSHYAEWLHSLPRVIRRHSPPKPGFLGDHPSLDIQTIVQRLPAAGLEPVAFSLYWRVGRAELRFSGLRTPTGEDSKFLYVQQDDTSGPIFRQVIEVVTAKTGKKLLRCPLSGQSCVRLFYRDGIFASAKAQRLIHASQRKPQQSGSTRPCDARPARDDARPTVEADWTPEELDRPIHLSEAHVIREL